MHLGVKIYDLDVATNLNYDVTSSSSWFDANLHVFLKQKSRA
jgi:hypothetical protein